MTETALALAFALSIFGFSQSGDAPLPGGRIHGYLASFSYSLYVSHWPLLVLVVAATAKAFSWGLRMTPSPGAIPFWALLVILGYAWAWCVAQLTEFRLLAIRAALLRWTGCRRPRTATGP